MLHACRITDINFKNNIFYTLNSRKKGKQFIYSMLNRNTIFFNVKVMYWLKAPIPRVDLIVKGKIAWPASGSRYIRKNKEIVRVEEIKKAGNKILRRDK